MKLPQWPKRPLTLAVLATWFAVHGVLGQCDPPKSVASRPSIRLTVVGSAADDSSRLGVLTGSCWGNGSLIRSSLSLNSPARRDDVVRFSLVDPTLASVRNSRIPVSLNDGAMWAGRGLNVAASAGLQATIGRVRLVLAPNLTWSQNLAFPILPPPEDLRRLGPTPASYLSFFASPWHSGNVSADLPLRFGTQPYTRVDPGETSVELSAFGGRVGATTASQWWGPGIRNALVMSNNSAGIPQVYFRTSHPVRTRFGEVEGHVMLGGLTESPFFDGSPYNNLRSLSAAVFTLRLKADSGLTIGVERAVYAAVSGIVRVPEHFADILIDWHRPLPDGSASKRSDQITGVFARWVFPAAGFEAHAEWAKLQPPSSLRELLVDPQRGQGYTVGLDWARPLTSVTILRLQTEATMLEQTPPVQGQEVPEFYASHSVRHGYTQQGQVVGAAIGPGSSSQFVGANLLHRNWQVGGSLGRIRWEEDAYYRAASGIVYRSHDVSLFSGMTGRYDSRHVQIEVGLTRTFRINYLFQSANPYLYGSAFDVRNTTLSLRLSPHLQPH